MKHEEDLPSVEVVWGMMQQSQLTTQNQWYRQKSLVDLDWSCIHLSMVVACYRLVNC